MTHRLVVSILLVTLLSACAATRLVRLETGDGAPLEYRPPTSNRSVKVDTNAFEEALAQWMLYAPLSLHPHPRSPLMHVSHSDSDTDVHWQRLMSKSFTGFCKPGQRRADCLSLLDDVAGLTEWDKLGIALGLSLDPLKESISKSVEETLAPHLFYTIIATGLITWAVLAANPEPVFTKAAAIISALLLIYLGVEAFLELVDAARELKGTTDSATTPLDLAQAGYRFANQVGPAVARVFVLCVTVVVSHGMTGGAALLASRLPLLPSFSEAATLGASQLGIHLANVGQVSAVAIAGNAVIISLPATAVAIVAQASGVSLVPPIAFQMGGREKFPGAGDADYNGPLPKRSWTTSPAGQGAHLVEKGPAKASPRLGKFNRPDTPRFYPNGSPQNAGQAHLRLHDATREMGRIDLKKPLGGFSTEEELLAAYRRAYADPRLHGIRGDLRTPDGRTVLATDVTSAEAFARLLDWAKAIP